MCKIQAILTTSGNPLTVRAFADNFIKHAGIQLDSLMVCTQHNKENVQEIAVELSCNTRVLSEKELLPGAYIHGRMLDTAIREIDKFATDEDVVLLLEDDCFVQGTEYAQRAIKEVANPNTGAAGGFCSNCGPGMYSAELERWPNISPKAGVHGHGAGLWPAWTFLSMAALRKTPMMMNVDFFYKGTKHKPTGWIPDHDGAIDTGHRLGVDLRVAGFTPYRMSHFRTPVLVWSGGYKYKNPKELLEELKQLNKETCIHSGFLSNTRIPRKRTETSEQPPSKEMAYYFLAAATVLMIGQRYKNKDFIEAATEYISITDSKYRTCVTDAADTLTEKLL